ncbi:MAG: 4-hydroxy-3-methylbut-2-enyl diphosphate reductase [Bacteroidales bacterium]|jgi:4-hydroxy-3-methylbut-2-enyl diphosphate reductase|nr:4-hydroxy-3-methylbut-2-enyl diphosphate reductase [Bacteroidales bacterium]
MIVRIEKNSGFCFGVVSAINIVEKELEKTNPLYCLGDIVHNDMEVERLNRKGLRVISLKEMEELKDVKVVIRAHGAPPSTYLLAKKNNIEIIDATCPIVLRLQQNVKKGFEEISLEKGQIVIYGKKGHAEVVGLVGQTSNRAIVISNEEDLNLIDYTKPIHIFSQTTMSEEGYKTICDKIIEKYNKVLEKKDQKIIITNSICKQVSSRSKELIAFSKEVDVLLFVSGKNSSNGIYLYNICKDSNARTFLVSQISDINNNWFENANTVGICGATSTPMWLMQQISQICTLIN